VQAIARTGPPDDWEGRNAARSAAIRKLLRSVLSGTGGPDNEAMRALPGKGGRNTLHERHRTGTRSSPGQPPAPTASMPSESADPKHTAEPPACDPLPPHALTAHIARPHKPTPSPRTPPRLYPYSLLPKSRSPYRACCACDVVPPPHHDPTIRHQRSTSLPLVLDQIFTPS